MEVNTEVINKIERIFNKAILPEGFSITECTLEAPYDREFNTKRDSMYQRIENVVPLRSSRHQFYDVLCRVLGQFTANPSDIGTMLALDAIYVTPEELKTDPKDNTDETPPFVNQSRKKIIAFAEHLSKLAQDNRQFYRDYHNNTLSTLRALSTEKLDLSNKSRIVLIGKKGVGKTIFLNYLLTVHNEIFEKGNTIFIRVDYTKTAPPGISLQNWIQWQFCRILFEFYDVTSKRGSKILQFDLSHQNRALYRYAVEANRNITENQFKTQFQEIKDAILGQKRPENFPQWIYKTLYDYLSLDHGVGFIFVIDGLDQLGVSNNQRKEFMIKLRDVKSYVFSEKSEFGVYVITMRYESYLEVAGHNQFRERYPIYQVTDVPSSIIYSRRINYVKHREAFSNTTYPDIHIMREHDYATDIEDVAYEFIRFATNSLTSMTGPAQDDPEVGFKILDDIFGTDKRALFAALKWALRYFVMSLPQSFDDLIFDSIEKQNILSTDKRKINGIDINVGKGRYKDIYRRGYLFIESMMLRDYGYHTNRFLYDHHRNGKESEFTISGDTGEIIFYNVFKYPYAYTVSHVLSVFCGIRVLQCFLKNGGTMDKIALYDFLSKYFPYDKVCVENQIVEMLECGVLEHCVSGTYVSSSEVTITPRGRFIYNRLVSTLEYVNLALQTVPLPKELLDKGFFPIKSYGGRFFIANNKIVAAVNFARLLSDVEKIERQFFNAQASPPLNFDNYMGYNFSIADKIKSSVKQSVINIVQNAYIRNHAELIQAIEERTLKSTNAYFGSGLE